MRPLVQPTISCLTSSQGHWRRYHGDRDTTPGRVYCPRQPVRPQSGRPSCGELIKTDKVDLLIGTMVPETTNPVADQAEINSVPCITTGTPWQAWFFGRGGNPAKGFDWTYEFCWGLEDVTKSYLGMWSSLPTNKTVGALWGTMATATRLQTRSMGCLQRSWRPATS